MEEELVKIRFTSVLDSEKWAKMEEKERKRFITKHANVVLPKLIKINVINDIQSELAKVYEVIVCYQLLDHFYNNHGEVHAVLEWSRGGNSRLISYGDETILK